MAAPDAFKATVDERRDTRDRLASLIPPFVFDGRQPPPETWERRGGPIRGFPANTAVPPVNGATLLRFDAIRLR